MDLNALRVYSILFNLGITEEEFASIDEELTNTVKGAANMLVKDTHLIYIDHDDKDGIKIRELEADEAMVTPSRTMCKIMISFGFEHLPDEVHVLREILEYRWGDEFGKTTASNIEELKIRLIDRFTSRSIQINTEAQMKAVYWLFGEPYKEFDIQPRGNINTILKVFESKNRRLAIYNDTKHHYAETFGPRNPKYNYVDKGREFNGALWISDELLRKLSEEEVGIIQEKLVGNTDRFTLLTPSLYSRVQNEARLEIMRIRREADDKEVRKLAVAKIEKQFAAGAVIRNGIMITRSKLTYNGLTLAGTLLEQFITRHEVITLELPDFNNIVYSYIDYACWCDDGSDYDSELRAESLSKKSLSRQYFTIGKSSVRVLFGNTNYFILPDKRRLRVRRDEVTKLLRYMLVCESQEKFNEFAELASVVSLRVADIIDKGFVFNLSFGGGHCYSGHEDNSLTARIKKQEFPVQLKVIREKSKNYVVLGDKKFKIKSIGHLFELQHEVDSSHIRGSYIDRAIRLLLQSLDGITPEDISTMISDGMKDWKTKSERSIEYLKKAVELSKATRAEDGYLVKGLSNTVYYVGDDLSVYTVVDGKQDKYLCLVDVNSDTTNTAGVNDCIAKRLLMLSKDITVASEIYNRGDKHDAYWLDLAKEANKT